MPELHRRRDRLRRQWDGEVECGPVADRALDPDLAAVHLHDLLNDRQPKPSPGDRLRRAAAHSARLEIVTVPPSGEYFTALLTRLLTTWTSRSRSPVTMGSRGSRSGLNSTIDDAVAARATVSLSTPLMSTSAIRMLMRPDSIRSRSSMSPIRRLTRSASLNM